MKKLISLLLILTLITAAAALPVSVDAETAPAFSEGDELYLRIENPANWATSATLYVNFSPATRADNDNKSVIIAEADKNLYDPVSGVDYDRGSGLYKYTVTSADAGNTVMRFWRGNEEKLWNESVAITAADLAAGKNTAVVTDWTNTGYLDSTYEYELNAKLTLSATEGEAGDSFVITVTHNEIPNADIACEIFINDAKVSDAEEYAFIPEADGSYAVRAVVTARNAAGRTVAADSETAAITIGTPAVTALEPNFLYAHAASGSSDKEAWVKWYKVDDIYYFFMPSSAKAFDSVELFSTLSDAALMNGTSIPVGVPASFRAEPDKEYRITIGNEDTFRRVKFMFSTAEAALWVNNTDSFAGYKDFFAYLKASKENSVAASGAVSTPDGKIENTDIKKMKGRGNTSWNADKKGFNVTFVSAIKLAGMEKCKKFSLVSNFQDAALARNRILFDISDEVGVPYSPDSRFIDLYTNGVYQGSYQICQKIDVGKNTLIDDVDADDYLDPATSGVKSDFSFVAEVDASPADDDFHITAKNGNNLTMKAPELSIDSPYYYAVSSYIYDKYNAMCSHLGKADVNDYLDIKSMAEVYIINELGKNWDAGVTSFFFVYKPDENGRYKFFASPVWDYDNSLGNASGVASDLRRMGVTDYTLPSGWFASKKTSVNGDNLLTGAVANPVIMAEIRSVWFEEFIPALDILNSKGVSSGELYSSDVYSGLLSGSAAMNYKIWALVTNSSWICDHGSLRQYTATYTKNAYGQITGVQLAQARSATNYDQYTFGGQFDYMMDWTNSRAAWISAQYIADYVPSPPPTEPTEAPTEAPTEEPTLPPEDVIEPDLSGAIAAWVFDSVGKTSGSKLTEYGSADNGYDATLGAGKLTMTVSGEKLRALEWSDAEYGKSGSLVVPIMGAGSKNPWGSPYVRFEIPATEYENLSLTLYLAGSSKCPAEWKLQYSTDGESFTDIEGATAKITKDNRKVMTAYFDKTVLPDFRYDCFHNTVILQLVPVSATTVEGGDMTVTTTGGELALNYAAVYGTKLGYEDVLMGDVDLSGEADIVDVTFLQRYNIKMISLTARQLKAADTTHDGEADMVDATLLQRFLLGMNVTI